MNRTLGGLSILLLLVLCLCLCTNEVDAIGRRSTRAHNRRKRHQKMPFPPMPMPFFPPNFPAAIPPLMPPAGGAGLANPLPSNPADMFRFSTVGSKTGTKAQGTTSAQSKGDDNDLARGVYNLLSKTRDMNADDMAQVQADSQKNRDAQQKIEARARKLKDRAEMLARLEACLLQEKQKSSSNVANKLSNATALANQAMAQLRQMAQHQAVLYKRQMALRLKEKDLLRREGMLQQAVEDLRKQELAFQTRLNSANQKLLDAAINKTEKCNLTSTVNETTGQQIKYVKVPEIIYVPVPKGCAAIADCSTCTAQPTCGWCEASKRCIETLNGTTSSCDSASWSFNFCKQHKCIKHVHCRSCMADPRCGMCGDTGACMPGILTGPSSGTCSRWNYATDFRFLSYNIYGRDLRNCTGRAVWLFKMIKQADADFIALQEVEDWFLEALAKERWALNYHMSDFGSGHAPGGLLILSKLPLEQVSYYEKTNPGQVEVDQRARLLTARPKIGSRNLVLATTTLDWRSADNRAKSLDFIFAVLNETADAVLMGDMNFDAKSQPETAHVPVDYHDFWTTVHPTLKGYTWDPEENSYAKESDPTSRASRIDRMFVKSGFWLASRIDKIGCPEASPHYGLVAEGSIFGAYC